MGDAGGVMAEGGTDGRVADAAVPPGRAEGDTSAATAGSPSPSATPNTSPFARLPGSAFQGHDAGIFLHAWSTDTRSIDPEEPKTTIGHGSESAQNHPDRLSGPKTGRKVIHPSGFRGIFTE